MSRAVLFSKQGRWALGITATVTAAIDNSEAEMAKTKLLTEDLKERMGSLIDLRAEQAGRSTPTQRRRAKGSGASSAWRASRPWRTCSAAGRSIGC